MHVLCHLTGKNLNTWWDLSKVGMDLCLFAHLVYYAHYYRHVNWCFSFLGPSIFEFKMGQTVVKFFVLFVRLHAEKLKRKTGCHPTGICVCRSHILQLYVCLWSEVGFNSIVNSSIKDHFACKPTLDTRAVGRVRVGCWGRGFGIGLHFSSAVQINLPWPWPWPYAAGTPPGVLYPIGYHCEVRHGSQTFKLVLRQKSCL